MTTSMLILTALLTIPALMSLWQLQRDLRNEQPAGPASGRQPPRSRADEDQTRAQVLAALSR